MNSGTVGAYAALFERYGVSLVASIIFGFFFLFIARMMFSQLIKRTDAQDAARDAREKLLDTERRTLTDRVLDVTVSATIAIAANTDATRVVASELARLQEQMSNFEGMFLQKINQPHASPGANGRM